MNLESPLRLHFFSQCCCKINAHGNKQSQRIDLFSMIEKPKLFRILRQLNLNDLEEQNLRSANFLSRLLSLANLIPTPDQLSNSLRQNSMIHTGYSNFLLHNNINSFFFALAAFRALRLIRPRAAWRGEFSSSSQSDAEKWKRSRR